MKKYNESDFMPPGSGFEPPVTEPAAESQDTTTYPASEITSFESPSSGEDTQTSETSEAVVSESVTVVKEDQAPNPEKGLIESINARPAWSRYVSTAFMPLLIPTYAMVMSVWLTPLVHVDENVRLGATFMVLLLTALAPMSYLLTMMRMGRMNYQMLVLGLSRFVPCIVFVVCQMVTAFYLYRVKAPEWLVQFMGAGAVTTLVTYGIHKFTKISGHAAGMGALLALICFLARHGVLDVMPLPWIMGIVLVAGLVGSARLAFEKSFKGLPLLLGYLAGFVVVYAILSIHIEALVPVAPQIPVQ